MFQFWLFADHGIHNGASLTLVAMRTIREFAPPIQGEFIIYVAG